MKSSGKKNQTSSGNNKFSKRKNLSEIVLNNSSKKSKLKHGQNLTNKNNSKEVSFKSENSGNVICDEKEGGEKIIFWEVDHVIGHRKKKGRNEYLIRWKGCSEDENTWEPTKNLCDSVMGEANQFLNIKKGVLPKPKFLEICSGSGNLSQALRDENFNATTVDFAKEMEADVCCSLAELRVLIKKKCLPFSLDHDFDVIWAAPDCRTWSHAAGGHYRNKQSLDGYPKRTSYKAAQAAKKEIKDIIHIFQYYALRNPNLIMVIENPEAYLQYHPVSKLFSKKLFLKQMRVSYCHFSADTTEDLPRKNTNLWSNSTILHEQLHGDAYYCHNHSRCMQTASGQRHQHQVYDREDRYSAYPHELCRFWARSLAGEVRRSRNS